MPTSLSPTRCRVLAYEYLSAGGQVPGLGAAETADLQRQGRAMLQAMLQDLQALPAVESCAAPETDDPQRDLAQAAAAGWQVWAVAPESGGLLQSLSHAVPATHWLGSSSESIALASSKRATLHRLAACGIAVPQAATPGAGWVVKPDDGAGATDTRRHRSFAAAEEDARARPTPSAIEPWIDGEPLSLSLVCSPAGAQVLAINRQHVEVDAAGNVHFRGVSPAAIALDSPQGRAVVPLAGAVAGALPGLRGYVGVDLVWTPAGAPVVIEVNPRLTTAYVGLSARLGFNVAARVLAAF